MHLDKGCYRGQETVARVHTLGRPPRRLVRLHLDGSADALPGAGHALSSWMAERSVSSAARPGTTSSARSVSVWSSATWTRTPSCWSAGIAASQEALVDPEVGLHVRPQLRS